MAGFDRAEGHRQNSAADGSDYGREQFDDDGRCVGVAAGGKVRVILAANGLADAVWLDPALMRRETDVVATSVRDAVREAQRRWFDRHAGAVFAEHAKQFENKLGEIHADYVRQLNEYSSLIDRLLREEDLARCPPFMRERSATPRERSMPS